MFTSLITTLRANDIEPTAEELADALWFSMQIRPSVASIIGPDTKAPLSQPPEKPVPPLQAPEIPPPNIEPPPSIDTSEPRKSQEPSLSEFETQRQMQEDSYPLYPRTARPTSSQTIGSRSFRTPAATMLPGALSLEKALRPLMRRVASRTRYVLDEAATVQRIAEQQIWVPVLQGAPERWFEVALVIDHSASMRIWQPTILEWRNLLERHGAFRTVRTWSLKNQAGQIQLDAGSRPCHPRELLDPLGRRLILVVSDCVAPPWYTGTMTQLLELWGKHQPVAIVQMLPQRLWASSALGEASRVSLQATTPGLANIQLTVDEDDFWFDDEDKPTGIKMPIVTLEPESLRFWARVVMGKGDSWTPGVLFESRNPSLNLNTPLNPLSRGDLPSAEQRVQHFYATASPTAQELAGYLAATPLTLPVMRTVQQVMLPQSRQVHLAEVFLGGLLKRVSPEKCHPMVIEYDFHDRVRDLMLDSVLVPDAIEVLKAVSEYLEKRLGQPLDFMAWLADPTATDGIVINEDNRAFAEIAAKVLRRLGGNYRKLATIIKNTIDEPEKLENSYPERQKPDLNTTSKIMNSHKTEFIDLLNSIVTEKNEIDVIFIADMQNANILIKNTVNTDNSKKKEFFLDPVVLFLAQYNRMTKSMNLFGKDSHCGELERSIFQLTQGSLCLYSSSDFGLPIAIGFISINSEGLSNFLDICEKHIGVIRKKLSELFQTHDE
jgi:hypothetical protein